VAASYCSTTLAGNAAAVADCDALILGPRPIPPPRSRLDQFVMTWHCARYPPRSLHRAR